MPFELQQHVNKLYRMQKNLLVLTQWQILLEDLDQLAPEYALPDKTHYWRRALAVQRLLTEVKTIFLQQQKNALQTADVESALQETWRVCRQKQRVSQQLLVDDLTQRTKTLRRDIVRLENALKPSSTMVSVTTKTAVLLLSTSYFRWADLWVGTSKELTQHLLTKYAPSLRVDLEPKYVKRMSLVGGGLFLSADLLFLQSVGLSSTMLNTLVELCITDLGRLMSLSQTLKRDELYVLENVQSLNKLLHLLVHVSVYCALFGFSAGNIAFFASGYGFSQLVQSLVNQLGSITNVARFVDYPNSYLSQLALVAADCVTYTGSTMLWSYGTAGLADFMRDPSNEMLMEDKELCQRYSERCEVVALEILQLPLNATSTQIYDRWRTFLYQQHPDKTSQRTDQNVISLTPQINAHRRLKDLKRV